MKQIKYFKLDQRKTRMTQTEEIIALAIARVIVLLVAIVAYAIRLVLKGLFKTKRQLWRLAVAVVVVSVLTNGLALTRLAYAPRAQAYYESLTPDLTVKQIVLSEARIEFGENQLKALDNIIMHESAYNLGAVNPKSGACGIFQSLPCNKMNSMSIQDQISFGFNYIKARYGNPVKAWAFWEANGWY